MKKRNKNKKKDWGEKIRPEAPFLPTVFPWRRPFQAHRQTAVREPGGQRRLKWGACIIVFYAVWRGSAVAGLVRPSLDWTWRDCGCVWSARCDWDAQPSPPLPLPGFSHLLSASDCFSLFCRDHDPQWVGAWDFFFPRGEVGWRHFARFQLVNFPAPPPSLPKRILQECAPAQTYGCVRIKDRLGNVMCVYLGARAPLIS